MTKDISTYLPEDVHVYTYGLCHCSVCAPVEMEPEEVTKIVNTNFPTGISSPWKITEETFSTGEVNGFENTCAGKLTRHWLFTC